MTWFRRKDATLALVLELREKLWKLEAHCNAQDKTIEEFRIRLSGPAQDAKPIQYKASDWLAQRKELESKFATQGENGAKQSAMS